MRDVWAGVCEAERAACRSVHLSAEAQPGPGLHTAAPPARGAHPERPERGGASARVWGVRSGAPRAASSRRFANFLTHPEPSLPPGAGTGGPEGGGRQRSDGLREGARRRHSPWGPLALAPAGAQPTARGGGPAQPGAPRAAAAAAEPRRGAGGAGGAGCGPGGRLPPPPQPRTRRGRGAPGAPRRPAAPRRLLTFASGPWGEPPARRPLSEPWPRGGIPSRGRPLPKCKRSVTLTGR